MRSERAVLCAERDVTSVTLELLKISMLRGFASLSRVFTSGFSSFKFFCNASFLILSADIFSMELNSVRLGVPAHGIVTKTVHKTQPGSLFCMSNSRPCAIICNNCARISFKYIGVL